MLVSRSVSAIVSALILTRYVIIATDLQKNDHVKIMAQGIVKSMRDPWITAIKSVMNSSESACSKEIAVLVAANDAEETWALRMLDASSKIQSGILQGNVVDYGMYDECVTKYKDEDVQGKHCLVKFGSKSLEFTSSVCLPSSCNETQALEIASSVIKNLLAKSSTAIEIEATTAFCSQVESEDFTVGEIWTIVFFSAVGAAILFCTMCEFAEKISPEKMSSVSAVKTLAKFSLYKNSLALFDRKVKPGTMPAINGIRFLSTCWIVIWHRYSDVGPLVNSLNYNSWFISWDAVWLRMSTFATDNFFMLSGFFTSYLFFKRMRSGGKFNLRTMYVHRYVRLMPSVAVVILFTAVLFHRMGKGPLWKTTTAWTINNCKENWWINFLYLQNFLHSRNTCIGQTWFLAADMQLFLLSPIILYPLHRCSNYGLGIFSFFLLASVVVPTFVIGINGYSILPRHGMVDQFVNYYVRFYTRGFSYLIGIILGYDIATKKRNFGQVTVISGWILTSVIAILCYLATHRLSDPTIEYNLAFEITCAILVRPGWALATAWVMYACTQGHGGILTTFLSLSIFLPLSRLSYGIYLVHLAVRLVRYGTSIVPGVFSHSEMLISLLGETVISIAVSAVISLFFEMPVAILENIVKTSNGKINERVTSVKKDEQEMKIVAETSLAKIEV